MLALAGMVLVFAAVLGGFLLERGNPYVLMQPAEVLIIVGAAAGIILVANPWAVIRKMSCGVARTFRKPVHSRASFLRNLRMLYEVFVYSQRSGGIEALEQDVEDPWKSAIFSRYPEFLRDATTRDFICDSLRMLIIGARVGQVLDLPRAGFQPA